MIIAPRCFVVSVAVGFLVAACSAAPRVADLVENAKAVVASHEQYAKAGDLDGVMTNVHPDIVLLTVGAPLVVGADAFRTFYAAALSAGTWDFTHDYQGSRAVGEVVDLYGVARGTLTPPGGTGQPFANNFVLHLRPDSQGRLKVWRAAFASSTP